MLCLEEKEVIAFNRKDVITDATTVQHDVVI